MPSSTKLPLGRYHAPPRQAACLWYGLPLTGIEITLDSEAGADISQPCSTAAPRCEAAATGAGGALQYCTWSTGAVNQSSHFAFSRVSRRRGLVPSQTWWVHEGLLKYCLVSDEGDIASQLTFEHLPTAGCVRLSVASASARRPRRAKGICRAQKLPVFRTQ